jgi:hypothetical protein
MLLTGCAEVITSVAINGGVQVVGEEYLIQNKKPMTKCNVLNVVKGNNICRIKRTYRIKNEHRRGVR